MKIMPRFLVVSFTLVVLAQAAELTDLGGGLSYLRVDSLDQAALKPLSAFKPEVAGAGLVIDFRYVVAPGPSPSLPPGDLGRRNEKSLPLFVLVSPSTPASAGGVWKSIPGRTLVLGIKGSVPTPDLVVNQSAADDRRAYDALIAGTPIETLLSGKIEKERFDEATLVKEFKDGNPDAEPPPAPDPTAPKSTSAPENLPRLVDRVLQRAIHLHQALLALRR